MIIYIINSIMAKYFSSYFIVRYFHLFLLSPYLLYLGYKLYDDYKRSIDSTPNKPYNFKTHSYILLFFGLFAGIYNYKIILDNSGMLISLFILLTYLTILGAVYKFKILNEQIKLDSIKKSIFKL